MGKFKYWMGKFKYRMNNPDNLTWPTSANQPPEPLLYLETNICPSIILCKADVQRHNEIVRYWGQAVEVPNLVKKRPEMGE